MQEYVKISTDKQTTELLKEVSEAIEFAIDDSLSNIQIKENLETVINNQSEFPNYVERLKEQLVKINTEGEKVSKHNLIQIIKENEGNKDLIINKIVSLFEKKDKLDVTLPDIHLLQKEIEVNLKPIVEIKERTISIYDVLSENSQKIIAISDGSSQTINKISKELSDIKEQITLNNDEMKKSINLILSKQDFSIEKIKSIEATQNKPWYKKLLK